MNRYERYKDSGIPWLGEVPEHWEVKKINHVIKKIGDTDHYMPETVDNGIPYLMTGDLQELVSQINFDNCKKVNFDEFVKLSKKIKTQRDDLILARYATIGTVSYVDIDDDFLVSYSCVTIKSNQIILNGLFLFYYFKSSIFLNGIEAITNTNTQGNVGIDDLKKLKFALPPLSEQTAIAHYLDTKLGEIDVLIDKQQTLLEKLAEQRTAVITHAVTKGLNPAAPMKKSGVEWLGDVPAHWEVLSIKRLSQVKRGASPRPIDNPDYFDDDGEYAWVRIADVTASSMYLLETTQRLSNLGKSFSVPLQPNNLFLSIAGSVGKPIITKIKACIHDGFVYFPEYKNNIKFLYYIFYSGQPYLGLGKMGTQLNLNTDTVGAIKIALPTKEEQDNITDYLDQETAKIDRLCETVNQTIGRLKEYHTALITQAVTGKIKVTDE